MSKGNLAHHHTCPAFCPRYIFENVVAGSCTCATCQIRRFYEGEGDSSTCLPHGEAFAKHIKVINEGILEVLRINVRGQNMHAGDQERQIIGALRREMKFYLV